jgi:hypothetical protein
MGGEVGEESVERLVFQERIMDARSAYQRKVSAASIGPTINILLDRNWFFQIYRQ